MDGRLTPLFNRDLNHAQRAMWESLVQSPRGSRALRPEGFLTGPFDALLRSPGLGAAAANLGTVIRFESSIEPRLRELAIATVAAHWRARWAWYRHAEIALQAGISESVLTAIAAGQVPSCEDSAEALVYDFVDSLVRTGTVEDEVYDRTRSLLGEPTLVELVALAGYYCMECLVLNAFAVPLPAGERVPWDPPQEG